MAVKIFLDANILLDFLLQRESYQESKAIIEIIINGGANAFITSSVLHIVGHWSAKKLGNSKAKELLITLLADISIIDIPHEIALIALHSKIDDIEDALQYYTAIHHKLDYFISRDKKLQRDGMSVLPVYAPKEFIMQIY